MTTTEPTGAAAARPTWLRLEATIAWRMLLIAAAALLVIWLGLQVTVIAIAAFVAFTQAALLWPVVGRLERHLPRAPATLLVVAVYAAGIAALAWFTLIQMLDAGPRIFDAVAGSLTEANDWFLERGWELPPEFVDNVQGQLQSRLGDIAAGLGGYARTTLAGLGSTLTVVVVALFATIFALIGGKTMTQGIVGAVPGSRQLPAFAAIRDAVTTARWWMFASTVTGAVDGIFIGMGLYLLGVPLAVPIGLLTFILGFIPMIGATVAGAVAVAVALFFNGVTTAIWVLLIVLAVQQIEGNVLSPLLMSRAMEFPPLLTLLLSTAGGIALGLPGLFLAVPIAGILTAAVRGWRRELPPELRAAKGIGAHPSPPFEELAARAAPRPRPGGAEQQTGQHAEPGPEQPDPPSGASADADRAPESPGAQPSSERRSHQDGGGSARHTLEPPDRPKTEGTP
ncbi:AI-2E family transporter [Ornithinimicrobium pratense]|uniref:AI-2E family transporter n=1 Tax=Ornithinimicrobium pratense TaxID=2593973 RepID=A0A5J6V6I9_9MICO|nr:AI-2E family transporter [Ornithinimicrobium pratense]QFG69630.1 AI-2E family transporter [Ornithinimicrobium pratense]